jgi:SAM-dependent methyltransferase
MSDAQIFDRSLYLSRVKRWKSARPAALGAALAMELAERILPINRSFENALLIAHDSEEIANALNGTGKVSHLTIAAPSMSDDLALAPDSLDAVFHMIDLQCVNDVPGVLAQMGRALKPDGLMIAALFAGESLNELRQSWLWAEERSTGGVSPRVAPMIDLRELGGLLQRAGLALPVADSDRLTLRYDNPFALMQDIRACGLSNMLRDRSLAPVSKRMASYAATYYQEKFADADGRVRATVEVAWAMGWSPHESQQQPLKPGSAKVRLADALKVTESKLKN